ncbi:hypothetical protein [Lactobacillus sp. M0396]|uniref:hypothetical protein n=2 Tax=Lactobacillus TaxID=1578 RepID=UPI00351B49CB
MDAEPHAGRKEGGHNPQSGIIQRPAIVTLNNAYNQKTGLVICMPLTHDFKKDNRGLYYRLADISSGISGSVVTFQMPNYDFPVEMVKLLDMLVIKTWITCYLKHIKF